VLLPVDTPALMRDLANGTASEDNGPYLSGFNASNFFYPGQAGYDAACSILAKDVPEAADSSFKDPIVIQISGSALLYELDWPIADKETTVPSLEDKFPGIRRQILEHHVRYTFVRFGVPYVVSVLCFDSSISRYRMPTCRTADKVAMQFLRALRVVGGTPQPMRSAGQLPIERPAETSSNFAFYAPGYLINGVGRPDDTVYSQIRFPLATAPASAKSQVYYNPGRTIAPTDPDAQPVSVDPWRDNFCERRGFPVGQCPAGIGHQGQDIRPAKCIPAPGTDRCVQRDDIVAVRAGVILRSPAQEAVYLFVNSANEHIRFRYLHMDPRKMDGDNLLSGRRVYEGEVIGQVSNFSRRIAGTSYHLHFDIQVPTKDGWVFVNPYMTLVASYERLLGARGIELGGTVPGTAVAGNAFRRATYGIGRAAVGLTAARATGGPSSTVAPTETNDPADPDMVDAPVAATPVAATTTETTASAGEKHRAASHKAKKKLAKRSRQKLKGKKHRIAQSNR
jgi:murein DD-endopeptidase MepM/ murein hydrolase activator NlpD